MKRVALTGLAVLASAAVCAQAAAAVATAQMQGTLVARAGVDLSTPLVPPSVNTANVVGSAGPTIIPTAPANTSITPATPANGGNGAAGPLVSNAALTIYGQSGDTVSMQVPASFRVVRTGGTESLTVVTNTNTEVGVDQATILGGTVLGGDTLSVNVGAAFALASAGPLVPGPYEGVLLLVVQYN